MVLAKKTLDQLKISPGERIRLSEHDPAWLPEHVRKLPAEARKSLGKQLLKSSVEGLASAQDLLYADDRWSLLVVFQAMDAAGKDSTIKHVMSGVNPQGCSVTSFKQPSSEDLNHNFLWRTWKAVPARGQIGIFNRSHYEEVLVVGVINRRSGFDETAAGRPFQDKSFSNMQTPALCSIFPNRKRGSPTILKKSPSIFSTRAAPLP